MFIYIYIYFADRGIGVIGLVAVAVAIAVDLLATSLRRLSADICDVACRASTRVHCCCCARLYSRAQGKALVTSPRACKPAKRRLSGNLTEKQKCGGSDLPASGIGAPAMSRCGRSGTSPLPAQWCGSAATRVWRKPRGARVRPWT